MPTPEFVGDASSFENPHTATEILGRGPESRKSKTLVKDSGVANVLGRIGGYVRMLTEAFKRLHAHHNTIPVEVENEEGEMVVEHVPAVLSDQEIRERYPIVQEWFDMHREHVEHYASVGGFSVKAAAGLMRLDREGQGSGDEGSSAGSGRGSAGDPDHKARWR